MDCYLSKNDDRTFSAYPFYPSADVRYLAPMLRFTHEPFRLWLQRVDVYSEGFKDLLGWIERVNARVFMEFDQKYDGG